MELVGIAVGMTFSAKFTGIFIVPMLVVNSVLDLWHRRVDGTGEDKGATVRQLTMSIMVGSFIGFFCIWAIYSLHYEGQPANLSLNPCTPQYLQELTSSFVPSVMLWVAQHLVLLEAYISGLAYTNIS